MWKLGIIFAETAEGQRETGLFHIYTYGKKQEGQNRTGQWVFSPDVENFCGLSTENPVWITRRGEMWKARTAALLEIVLPSAGSRRHPGCASHPGCA